MTLTDLYNAWHYEITDENNELIIIMTTMTTTTMTIFKTMLRVAFVAAAAIIISWRKFHSLMFSVLLFLATTTTAAVVEFKWIFRVCHKKFYGSIFVAVVFMDSRYVGLLPLLMAMIYELLAKWYARALCKTGCGPTVRMVHTKKRNPLSQWTVVTNQNWLADGWWANCAGATLTNTSQQLKTY